jgi:CubicO group peptidase (beta-lactamase class C family)
MKRHWTARRLLLFAGTLCFCLLGIHQVAQSIEADPAMTKPIEALIAKEMADYGITGISIALVDDQKVIYSQAYGDATKESLFRVGSISKLFNAVAVMQLVEKGELDLDAPLSRYAGTTWGVNPFPGGPEPTLRQVLCHRSGLPREASCGGYFDGEQPSLDATIDSMADCPLATAPNAKTRYSNIGIALSGWIGSKVANQSFEALQRHQLLTPLGMDGAGWTIAEVERKRILPANMRIAYLDENDPNRYLFRQEPAPLFDLGTVPAGNLFASAEHLARFVSMLAAEGKVGERQILKPETLQEMWRPQLTENDTGFGLGFMVGKLGNRKMVSHNGAVYGYSCSLLYLPDSKVGAIVLGNEDIANGRISKIALDALGRLNAAKTGESLPPPAAVIEIPAADLARYAGEFESESYWAHLEVADGKLVGNISGQPARFSPLSNTSFLVNSRIDADVTATFDQGESGEIKGFKLGMQQFSRVTTQDAAPASWKHLVGGYGPAFIPLIVTTRNGHLYVMTENMVDYRLKPVTRQTFQMPLGMYTDEYLEFQGDPAQAATAVALGNMRFTRMKGN